MNIENIDIAIKQAEILIANLEKAKVNTYFMYGIILLIDNLKTIKEQHELISKNNHQ